MSGDSNPSLEELLILAVAFHGSSRDVVIDETRGATSNGMKILKQVLIWQARWDPEKDYYEDGQFADPTYPALIRMALTEEKPLIVKGFGNLGYDTAWCSAPRYVAFGLTAEGWDRAAELQTRYPGYQPTQDDEIRDG